MVAATIAIASGNVGTTAFKDLSRPIADAACVVLSDTIVVDVAHTVSIGVRHAVASAHAEHVKLVAATIAIARRDVGAPTFVDLSRSVADAARVVLPDAIVVDVAHTVTIRIGHAVASTDA